MALARVSRILPLAALLLACGGPSAVPDASVRDDAGSEPALDDLVAVAESDMPVGTAIASIAHRGLGPSPAVRVTDGGDGLFVLDGDRLVVAAELPNVETRERFTLTLEAGAGESRATATATVDLYPAHDALQDPRIGPQSLLWMRVSFADGQHRDAEAFLDTVRDSINRYVRAQSYGQTWFEPFDVAPVLDAPWSSGDVPRGNPAAPSFLEDRIGALMRDADVDVDRYAYRVYSFPAGGLDIGGGALGRSYAAWIPDQTWIPGTVHEMIHTLGVAHAEIAIGPESFPAERVFAGIDPYFFMGSERSPSKEELPDGSWRIDAPLNAPMRHRIGWIRPSNTVELAVSGTYRVYDVDRAERTPGMPMVLQVIGVRELMVSYTPQATGDVLVTRGVMVHEIPPEAGFPTVLLDGRPDSIPEEDLADDPARSLLLNQLAECHDAALTSGDRMVVPGVLAIEVLGEGADEGGRWADVRIDLE